MRAEHCFVVEDSISFLLALDVDPQVARTSALESMETSLSDGTYEYIPNVEKISYLGPWTSMHSKQEDGREHDSLDWLKPRAATLSCLVVLLGVGMLGAVWMRARATSNHVELNEDEANKSFHPPPAVRTGYDVFLHQENLLSNEDGLC
jgi:hypothetical protein|mmetsp:Transcript_11423/g.20861  ORF Transcript_11423/g.20861 Transcript_11423/m.20861 type:complete len:149 (-) Transcript_11423:65-511(-)